MSFRSSFRQPDPTDDTAPEHGFTLIELMVVVLIIALLIGIAVPTFLGVRRSAEERSSQVTIGVVYTNSLALYAAADNYSEVTTADLEAAEPVYTYVDSATPSDGNNTVSVRAEGPTTGNPTTPDSLYLAIWSGTGACFFNRDLPNDPVLANRARTFAIVRGAPQADCSADTAATLPSTAWTSAGWAN